MSTLGKILLGVVLLGVGLVVGYQLGQRKAPPPTPLEKPVTPEEPIDKLVKFKRVGTKLVDEHQPVYLSVTRGEKVVWESDIKEFVVTVVPYVKRKPTDPEIVERTKGPECPFAKAQDGCTFRSTNGRVESGPGKLEAAGHWYRFHIQAGRYELDPHICFHDGRGCGQ